MSYLNIFIYRLDYLKRGRETWLPDYRDAGSRGWSSLEESYSCGTTPPKLPALSRLCYIYNICTLRNHLRIHNN